MALKKSLTTKAGFTAEYIRLGQVEFNRLLGKVILRVDAYKNQAKRVEDLNGIAESYTYVFPTGDINENSNLTDIYEYLKGLEEYQGALDA